MRILKSLVPWLTALLLAVVVAAPAAAEPASDFSLRTLDGQPFKLSTDGKGKVVVLSFWATWCGPCKEEMPHLQALHEAHADEGLAIVSISTDDPRTFGQVKPFIRSRGYTFTVVSDRQGEVANVYNPGKTLPWTVIIDRKGEVVESYGGYNPGDEAALAAKVQALLQTPAAP